MMPDATNHDEITLLERKPLKDVLLSGFGIFMCLMGFISCGTVLVVLLGIYFFGTPRRLWIRSSRLYCDKVLPKEGVPLENISVGRHQVYIDGVKAAQALKVYFTDAKQQERFVGFNRGYYRRDEYEMAPGRLHAAIAAARNAG
jgi:hypothetical protein